MEPLDELVRVLGDPRLRHAAVVHLPVALSVLGVPAALALALRGGRTRALALVVLGLYAALAAGALVAMESGAEARALLGAATDAARASVATHEALARRVWQLAGATAAAAAASLVPARRGAQAARAACLGLALLTAGWVALVGHHGGTAVYVHGAGLPAAPPARPAGPPDDELPAPADPRLVAFRADVRPLLERTCMGCHGPGRFAAGGLDLTTMRGALAGGGRGPALVPGDAAASLLWRAVAGRHPTLRMPLDGEPLAAREVEALRAWIDAGAVWE